MTAHALARVFGLITTTVMVACHHGAPKRSQVLPESGIIGDSTGVAARIIAFNAGRDRATIALEEPAYLVLLAVSPGKSVEPVYRGVSPDTAMTPAGVHSLRVVVHETLEQSLDPPRLLDLVDYQRCVDQYARARTRPKPKRVVRDSSTGMVVEVEPLDEPVPLDERQAERACSRILRRPGPEAPLYRGALPCGHRVGRTTVAGAAGGAPERDERDGVGRAGDDRCRRRRPVLRQTRRVVGVLHTLVASLGGGGCAASGSR